MSSNNAINSSDLTREPSSCGRVSSLEDPTENGTDQQPTQHAADEYDDDTKEGNATIQSSILLLAMRILNLDTSRCRQTGVAYP